MRIRLVLLGSIIAVAGIAGTIMWTGTGSRTGLANVLAQVQKITAYMFQTTMTLSGKDPTGQDTNENMEGTALISQDDGMQIVTDSVDPNSGKAERMETYVLLEEKAMIWLWPPRRPNQRLTSPQNANQEPLNSPAIHKSKFLYDRVDSVGDCDG